MAIALDNCTSGQDSGPTTTISHTTAVDATFMVVFSGMNEGDPSCSCGVSATYAGDAMIDQGCVKAGDVTPGDQQCTGCFTLANPAAGTNNMVLTHGSPGGAVCLTYTGVDENNPIDNDCQSADLGGQLSSYSCTVTHVVGGHVVAGGSAAFGPTLAWSGGVTERCEFTTTGKPVDSTIGAADGPSVSPSVTPVMTPSVTRPGGVHAFALNPSPPTRGRAIKYYYNFWDPDPVVRDEAGREVPPNEIRPDNWIEVEGIALPGFDDAASFVQRASVSRIVEVSASDRAATLKTDVSQFADVLITRASRARG